MFADQLVGIVEGALIFAIVLYVLATLRDVVLVIRSK